MSTLEADGVIKLLIVERCCDQSRHVDRTRISGKDIKLLNDVDAFCVRPAAIGPAGIFDMFFLFTGSLAFVKDIFKLPLSDRHVIYCILHLL